MVLFEFGEKSWKKFVNPKKLIISLTLVRYSILYKCISLSFSGCMRLFELWYPRNDWLLWKNLNFFGAIFNLYFLRRLGTIDFFRKMGKTPCFQIWTLFFHFWWYTQCKIRNSNNILKFRFKNLATNESFVLIFCCITVILVILNNVT